MKAMKRKNLRIELSFRSSQDLIKILDQVRREIRTGEQKVSGSVRGLKFNFDLSYANEVTSHARVETINGKDCMILPSKINQK